MRALAMQIRGLQRKQHSVRAVQHRVLRTCGCVEDRCHDMNKPFPIGLFCGA